MTGSCPGCGLTSPRRSGLIVHVRKCPWLITFDDFVKFGLVDASDPSSCWIWKPETNQGYGDFGSDRAHRQAYRIAYGIEPGDLNVCHLCDNPPCVNPAHLFLGTTSDNIKDAVKKGRVKSPMLDPDIKKLAASRLPRGGDHWAHKESDRFDRVVREGRRKTKKYRPDQVSSETEDLHYYGDGTTSVVLK